MSNSPTPTKEKGEGSPGRFLGRKPTLKGLIKTMQPNLETLSKWSPTTAQQAITEKFKGKKTESVDMKEKEKIILDLEEHLPKIYRPVRKATEINQDLGKTDVVINDGYLNFFNKLSKMLQKHDDDWDKLNDFLKQMGDTQKQMSQLRSTMVRNHLHFLFTLKNQQLNSEFITPLSDFIKTDIHKAKEAKSKWSQSRLAYDAALSKYDNEKKKGKSTKLKEFEVECNVAKANFQQVDRKTSRYLDNTIDLLELLLINVTANYVQSLQEYHQTSLDILQKLDGTMNSLRQEYNVKKDAVYATQIELMTDTVSPTTPRKQEPSFIKEEKPTLAPPKPAYSGHSSDQEVDFSDSDAEDDKLDDLLLLASDDEEDDKQHQEKPQQQQQQESQQQEQQKQDLPPKEEPTEEEEVEKEKRARLYSSVGAMSMENFGYVASSKTPATTTPSINVTQVPVVEASDENKEFKLENSDEEEEDNVEVGESLMEQSNDVGEVLRRMMEEEDKKMQKEWDQQQKAKDLLAELELVDKNKVANVDWSKELQLESQLHHFINKKTKYEYITEITSKMLGVKVNEFEDVVDTGKLGGEVHFGLGGIQLHDVQIPFENVAISFDASAFTIIWTNITASVSKFSWHYKKDSFPKLKDNGFADASVSDTIISVTFELDKTDKQPVFKVSSSAVKIGSLDIKISGTAASVIYNMVLGAFSSSMKTKMQDEIGKALLEYFQREAKSLISEWAKSL